MKRRSKLGVLALAIGAGLLLVRSCFPIMEVTDGCECGFQRTWYEMPDSLWQRHRFFMRVDKIGNAAHAHQLWDAQWGVWYKLPWQK